MLAGLSLFLVELVGLVVVTLWSGAGLSTLTPAAHAYWTLAIAYAAIGGVAAWLGGRISARARALAPVAVFVVIALTNPPSVLPLRTHLGTIAVAALPAILLAKRRANLVVAGILAGGFVATIPRETSAPAGSGKGPNVVLIVIDTLRRDHVSAYGYPRPTTPNLDRLAAEGAIFTQATNPETWTLPSHASLFTGLYPRAHGAHGAHPALSVGPATLAGDLAARGWRTGAFFANPWLSAEGMLRGFQDVHYVGTTPLTETFLLAVAAGRDDVDQGAQATADALVRWAGEGGPFFAFANLLEVHEPYGSVPEPTRSLFTDRALPPRIGQVWLQETGLFGCAGCDPARKLDGIACVDGDWRIAPDRLRDEVALYDAGLVWADAQIGRIRESLGPALDDTVFVVTSDHGETLGERGRMGHGTFPYESVLDVPLIVRYPKAFAPGTRVDTPVSLVDVKALVEGLVEGRVVLPDPARPVVSEYIAMPTRVWKAAERAMRCDESAAGRGSVSLREGTRKYIRYADGTHQLFDLASDPAEEHPLDGDVADLAAVLDAWEAANPPGRAEGGSVDPVTQAKLRELGYLQ